ncbi:hypothetical protein B7P43_G08697 [Cryptotermes secundus]|uniref:Integrase catalytic domain-containing protein n=1 Tax=Cryptotermes secundus TaxID=105785 RepID=A0A2J7R5X2_9NEOP|nr:hypothetical protein B7P43_G08697 [Cryptotermes secundus]
MERFHRTLKAVIICHADQHCSEALLLVLGIRTAFKEDLQAKVAELVFGELQVRLPTHGSSEPKCTHVFLLQDTTRRALAPSPSTEAPNSSCYREKTPQILVGGRPATVSTDRVKPAYMLNETHHGTTTATFNPGRNTTCRTITVFARTARSGPHVRLPPRFSS